MIYGIIGYSLEIPAPATSKCSPIVFDTYILHFNEETSHASQDANTIQMTLPHILFIIVGSNPTKIPTSPGCRKPFFGMTHENMRIVRISCTLRWLPEKNWLSVAGASIGARKVVFNSIHVLRCARKSIGMGSLAHNRQRLLERTGNLAVMFIANYDRGFSFAHLNLFGMKSIAM